ncbi:hypothetical protein Nepgr_013496 [Nepenthes gracilis]|uniref:Uncharacterized protein n=1 Tax=Nepenthes gracilis TaxID=150966 RepID=A0AAD3XPG6_NEPGR|nr:hypothetical protein Nepgr_013496 [Nepenthes gracilis]
MINQASKIQRIETGEAPPHLRATNPSITPTSDHQRSGQAYQNRRDRIIFTRTPPSPHEANNSSKSSKGSVQANPNQPRHHGQPTESSGRHCTPPKKQDRSLQLSSCSQIATAAFSH